ncbi:hypothetical protein GGR54DRAFT_639116 [Hypoxylon sp. NC1633]|nr:hypothetical protein GGR54DRAFT_639116 [Hypoxylon sp. NC1633]
MFSHWVVSVLALSTGVMGMGRFTELIDFNGTVVPAIHDDVKVLCGAPPNIPDNSLPSDQYAYPVGLLLSGGDKKIHVDAGPGNCKQAACNAVGGAGVIICNDEKNAIDILYTDVGFFAQRVYQNCRVRKGDDEFVQKGQAFCPDGWNVILTDIGKDCTAPTLPGSK